MVTDKLNEFFQKNKKMALGFSGGVDSSYLLYAGKTSCVDIQPYYIKTMFQPDFELEDAKKMAASLQVNLKIIELDILSKDFISENPEDRCYHCKNEIFSNLIKAAKEDGYDLIIDGTNASDEYDDRPGMKALQELEVRSPLREAGLTKVEIRRLSKEAGLFTWNKPAYSCLATRISTKDEITPEKLEKIEKSELELFKLGFSDFRIRYFNGAARIQIKDDQVNKFIKNKEEIKEVLNPYFDILLLDMEGR